MNEYGWIGDYRGKGTKNGNDFSKIKIGLTLAYSLGCSLVLPSTALDYSELIIGKSALTNSTSRLISTGSKISGMNLDRLVLKQVEVNSRQYVETIKRQVLEWGKLSDKLELSFQQFAAREKQLTSSEFGQRFQCW